MEEIIVFSDSFFTLFFFFCSFLLFYLSIKKCFWKGNKSRVGLFFLALFTCPFVYFFASVWISSEIYYYSVLPVIYHLFGRIPTSGAQNYILATFFAFIYLGMIFLGAWICRKWNGESRREPVLFLYMMFNAINVIALRDTGNNTFFSIPHMGNVINLIGTGVMFIALWSFYCMDIKAFGQLAKVNVEVNWKIFIIPPTIFVLLYSAFAYTILLFNSGEEIVITIFIFSTVIVFLFIWAFRVIMNNITATNEALMAKDEVKTLSIEVMEALAHTIDAKDEYTRGHSVRVAKYSRLIAKRMGLTEEECENVYYMGLLHDIGKIGVPNSIINSSTKLTDQEYAVVKIHPGLGYDILSEIKSRPDLSIGARWHHERYDGKGYPDGKNGEEIPIWARIIAVADSYDAMTSNRSYRKFLPQEQVRSEIEKNAGTQFDPEIAKIMVALIDEDKDYMMHE